MKKQNEFLKKFINPNCLIVVPFIKRFADQGLIDFKCHEAEGLANTINLNIIQTITFGLDIFKPGYLLKAGKIEEVKLLIDEHEIGLVYVDNALTPVQQRNLEKAWDVKVIDRTGLILEIFASRARTKEGKLQVRLAQLEYQKSRLVRLWTHLERQRGGLGNIGGPGETQMEADKRMIKDEMFKIRQQLEKVKTTRQLHRKSREQVPYPVIALVGYTNAGKSTLFNLLTNAQVLAEDKLFATLDPTMRILKLPSRKNVILSDTVGFIADLPTELVAAFSATLEEVVEADIILHVIDSTSLLMQKHIDNVVDIIRQLGIEDKWGKSTIHVYNKVDDSIREFDKPLQGIEVSALKNINIDLLLKEIDARLSVDEVLKEINVDINDGEQIAWLYQNSYVIKSEELEDFLKLSISISAVNLAKWEKYHGFNKN